MTRKFSRLLCLILAGMLLFCIGCKDNAENLVLLEENKPNIIKKEDFEETSEFLVNGGITSYVIVLSNNPQKYDNTAKDELTIFFKEATGITLPTKTESEVTYTATSKFIILGQTQITVNKGIVPTYEQAGENGYVIKMLDNSIFITGYSSLGTLFGVYKFLELEFDYDYFAQDRYQITKITDDVKIRRYDVLDVPDIGSYSLSYSHITTNAVLQNRLRMSAREESFLYINAQATVHNTLSIFPLNTYYDDHKDWFADDKSEICFTAHGNEEEFEAMTTELCNNIIGEFQKGKPQTMVLIGQQDGGKNCTCASCTEVYSEYGAHSAKAILFCNRVLEKIYAWFDTEEGRPYRREFYLMLLVYEKMYEAPASLVDGVYVPNNGLEINDHFGVMLADLYRFNYGLTRAEAPDQYAVFDIWDACSNAFSIFGYDSNYICYLTPYDSFHAKRDLFKALEKVNCVAMTESGHANETGLPGAFSMLKCYLWSKLRWDTNADLNYYTEKYFKGVYGDDIGEDMLNAYYLWKIYWRDMAEKCKTGEVQRDINKLQATLVYTELWEKNFLDEWLDIYNVAYDKSQLISGKEGEILTKYVAAERVSPLYLLIELYGDYYSESDLFDMKMDFKSDVLLTGKKQLMEQKSLASVLEGWGV